MSGIAKHEKYNGARIVLSAVLASTIFVCQILEYGAIVSFCFALSIALVILNYCWAVVSTRKISADIVILLFLLLLSFIASGIRLDFDLYKRAMIVLCCVICLTTAKGGQLTLQQLRAVELSFLAAAVFAAYMYYFGGMDKVYFGSTQSVALNFSNPNACGMWLTIFVIALTIFFFIEKNKLMKFVFMATTVSLLPIVEATDSRNSLLACAVFIIAIIFSKLLTIKKIPKFVLGGITVLPLIVFFVYMYIVIPNLAFFEEWFSFLLEDGKTLTSRVGIWQLVLDDMKECFWFGRYNYYQNEQMHNSLMTLYCMFGGLTTFFICRVFYRSVKALGVIAQIALGAIWFTGCFEASVFVGVAGIYLALEILPAISNATSKHPMLID